MSAVKPEIDRSQDVFGHSMDAEYLKKLREAFDFVDKDKSGKIEYGELDGALQKLFASVGSNEKADPNEVKQFFDAIDTDHSGKIDFNEFSVLIKDVLNAMIEDDN